MSKKVVLELRNELFAELDKEAGRKLLKVEDLIYQLLVNHVKRVKKNPGKPGRPKKKKFEEIFSRKKR